MKWTLLWSLAESLLELLRESLHDQPALDTYRTEKTIEDLEADLAAYRATWETIKQHQIKCPTCRGAGVLVPGPGAAEDPPEEP